MYGEKEKKEETKAKLKDEIIRDFLEEQRAYKSDIVKSVFHEVIHKIDRNYPKWIEYKRSVMDLIHWGLLQIDKKHAHIEKAKTTIPAFSSHQKTDRTNVHQDSAQLPNWLLNEQAFSQAEQASEHKELHLQKTLNRD